MILFLWLANLTENDGLIIIGVDESDDYKVQDVKKKTQTEVIPRILWTF